ncbi:MAG: TIGR04086 family membrane protein [Oscillospiraceae bacterium]|nr:TIGR04086 family membrane protein [Oscillospiraceae bacterium]
MTVNQKVTGTASTIPGGLAAAGLVSMGITAALSALAAWLILRGTLPEQSVGYCSMVILLLGAAAGAVTAIARIKRRRFQMGLASGGIYFACLLLVTALFFGGVYDGVGVTALMILCGCGLVILLVPNGQNRAGCRRRKKRH